VTKVSEVASIGRASGWDVEGAWDVMPSTRRLSYDGHVVLEAFLDVASAADQSPGLRHKLADLYALGAARWPELAVPPEVFGHYVGQVALSLPSFARRVDDLRACDLYLAAAALSGVDGAWVAFEEAVMSDLPDFLAPLVDSDELIALVLEDLATLLVFGAADQPPKLASYTGVGPLRSYVKLAALRVLQDRGAALAEAAPDTVRQAPTFAALGVAS
jgi:RNA polymerase sigma-70 factor (ECF subfamily)